MEQINDVLPVTEARRTLPTIIDSSTPTVIGSYGRAQAVLVPADRYRRTAPASVVETLLSNFPEAVAHYTDLSDYAHGSALHPGDQFGRVAAWLWHSDQHDRLWLLLADTISSLRRDADARGADRPLLDDLLGGVGFSLPSSFERVEREKLLAAARERVPAYFGADPNVP